MAFSWSVLGFARATALSRLLLVLAVATLYLTAQGEQVVAAGLRRWVDAHWFRGNSYLRIGWEWVKGSVHQGWKRFNSLFLTGKPDPEPAIASRQQALSSVFTGVYSEVVQLCCLVLSVNQKFLYNENKFNFSTFLKKMALFTE